MPAAGAGTTAGAEMTADAFGEISTDRTLRRVSAALSVVGLIVSLYLVYIKFYPKNVLCTGAGGCETVNLSPYSWVLGIPVAALGAAAYLTIIIILLFESRSAFAEKWGPMAVFGLALIGTLYSAYLTYIEFAVIHAVCPYCVTSAVMVTLIFTISIVRLKRYM